jgi:serine protease
MNIFTKIFFVFILFSFTLVNAAPPPFKHGQIIVQGTPYGLNDLKVVKRLPLSDITVFEIENGKELGQVQRLRKQGVKAGLNFIAQASATTNDTYYPYQWNFPKIQIPQAWDVTQGARDGVAIIVAVLDTGIVNGGPDGVNLCGGEGGRDVVNSDDDPSDGNAFSHGTHVSGTIAQLTNFDLQKPAGTGTGGVAPSACVLPVKVLDDTGSGSFADITEGIYYAVDNGAKVINMSLGVNARYGMTSDPFVDSALDHAEDNDVLVVAAAGNDNNRKNVSYPAIYSTVVAVGATDYANKLAGYSNRGTGLNIVAPGGDTRVDLNGDGYGDGILQETYNADATNGPAFGYYFLQGTSMAAPHVAGVAALLYANGLNTVNDIRQALFSTTTDLGSANFDSTYGHGLIQAYSALSLSEPVASPPSAATNPIPSAEYLVDLNVSLQWQSADYPDSYDVYLASDPNTLQKIGNTTTASFNPETLSPSTLYYWQVLAINSVGTTWSSVWSFTTATAVTNPEPPTSCTDADTDGYCANLEPLDCDDNDPNVYPGHPDSKGRWGRDGVDNDCNGTKDG